MPGGAAGLQNQSGGRKVPGGFDSLPSPPQFRLATVLPTLLTYRLALALMKIQRAYRVKFASIPDEPQFFLRHIKISVAFVRQRLASNPA